MSALPATEASLVAESVRLCGQCECRLSRYNRENYCSGCIRHVGETQPARPLALSHVWRSLEVQRALTHRDFGRLCLLVRQLGSLRQEDVAALTGLSQAFLSMLEAGVRRLTNIDKIVQLLDGLQAPMELTGPMLRASTEHGVVHEHHAAQG